MNRSPKITFLVHGGPNSIEAVRARGLAGRIPSNQLQFLFREGSRVETSRQWNQALGERRPDLVYVCNTAIPGAPLAVALRISRGVPFVLDTGDAIYEMARSSGIGAGWKLPWLWLVEQSTQRCASTVVVRGTRHRECLLSQGIRRVELIRDGFAEQSSATPAAVATLRTRLGLDGRFVVGVMGSLVYSPKLDICYGWDLVEALASIGDLPVHAVVIGDGSGRPWLEEKARRAGVLDRICFCGRIPYAEVPVYLRLMDVALSTQTNNMPGQVRTTGKLPEYMAAQRFILASRVGEAALLLPEIMLLDYDGEVDPSYPQLLAQRIRLLHSQPGLLECRSSLSALATKLCSYSVLSGTFEKLVSNLVPNHGFQTSTYQS